MMEKRFLRILYTINAGHYILSRSLCPVEITPINTNADGSGEARFGSVSLKRCLGTVCQSSPEIFQDISQDKTRDFSVYLLDPLEADAAPEQVHIADTGDPNRGAQSQGRGVAVGMGLMSWGLESEDSEEACVNGTLMKLPNGSAALEVVLALRETVRMSKTLLPGASEPKKRPGKKATIQPNGKRSAKNIVSEADRLCYSEGVYIGPQKTQTQPPPVFGRANPKLTSTSTSSFSRSTSLPAASTTLDPPSQFVAPFPVASTSSQSFTPATASKSAPHTALCPPSSTLPQPRAIPPPSAASLPPIDPSVVPQLLSFLTGTPSSEATSSQSAALLAVLGSIDGSHPGEGNPALVRALQVLLATTPDTSSVAALPDKENVNPSPRRRPSQDKPISPPTAPSSPSPQRAGLGGAFTEATSGTSRKRTFSDFLSTQRLGQDPFTSPVRPSASRITREAGGSRGQPILIPDSPQPSRVSASSPVKPPPAKTKRYVLPSWARTDTALRPRLSEDAVQLQEAAEERRKQELREKRKKKSRQNKINGTDNDAGLTSEDVAHTPTAATPAAATPSAATPSAPTPSAPTPSAPTPSAPTPSEPQTPPSSPQRRAASMSVVAACGNDVLASIFSTPKRKARAPATPVPCTPPRRRDPSTPISSSLFTPLGWGTPLVGGDGIFSPLSSKTLIVAKPDASEENRPADATDTYTPASLPIASDDEDASTSKSPSAEDLEPKEFWLGLPPSSPMQSSSPLLDPEELETEEGEYENDIPVATSEMDFDPPVYEDEGGAEGMDTPSPDPNAEAMDVLDMFTNLNSMDSDEFTSDAQQIDFAEFWASVKPAAYVAGGGSELDGKVGELDFGNLEMGTGGEGFDGVVDAAQLAEQVQSLFSGCLM